GEGVGQAGDRIPVGQHVVAQQGNQAGGKTVEADVVGQSVFQQPQGVRQILSGDAFQFAKGGFPVRQFGEGGGRHRFGRGNPFQDGGHGDIPEPHLHGRTSVIRSSAFTMRPGKNGYAPDGSCWPPKYISAPRAVRTRASSSVSLRTRSISTLVTSSP